MVNKTYKVDTILWSEYIMFHSSLPCFSIPLTIMAQSTLLPSIWFSDWICAAPSTSLGLPRVNDGFQQCDSLSAQHVLIWSHKMSCYRLDCWYELTDVCLKFSFVLKVISRQGHLLEWSSIRLLRSFASVVSKSQ